MTEPRLFDPQTTAPPKCTACGATDKDACDHNIRIREGLITATRKRPKSCLNAYDPSTAPFPDGF